MNKTKIDWADMTWNPVTGCLHGCEYCYARGIAHRFAQQGDKHCHDCTQPNGGILHEKRTRSGNPWRYDFAPTLHPYRLREPQCKKQSQRIFVCSMADLFGKWVPDEWIHRVLGACVVAPHHKYMFLTKNPGRYVDLQFTLPLPTSSQFWYGFSHTDGEMYGLPLGTKRFVSIEPLHGPVCASPFTWKGGLDWVIIGAETGNRKGMVVPKREWIEGIVTACREAGTPVFMKNSLAGVWGDALIQEWPEGLERHERHGMREESNVENAKADS